MPRDKFDELDRERVIREVEQRLGVRLSRFRRRRKVLTDDAGNIFVVLGGVGEWHGLPKELVEHRQEGTLVFAKRTGETFKVFTGPLGPLVRNADRLYTHDTGEFSFHVECRQDHATIQKIPGAAHLSLLCEFVYKREDKDSDQNIKEMEKTIAGMTPAERNAFVNLIADGSGE